MKVLKPSRRFTVSTVRLEWKFLSNKDLNFVANPTTSRAILLGDAAHSIHPLAGQGFNMTIRDIRILNDIIQNKIDLGLPLDSRLNAEFESIQRHKNFIFSSGIDLIYEFFNLERKTKNDFLSKSIQYFNKNSSINKIFTTIADKGLLF